MNTFLLEERDFNRNNSKAYEGLFAQGNGYLSVRGSFEEGLMDAPQNEEYNRTMKSVTTEVQRSPLSKWGVYVPLIMGYNPFLEEVILNLPYFLSICFTLDGQPLDLLHSEVADYQRSLNMKNGVLRRTFTVKTPGGALVDFAFERFASMAEKHLFVQKVEVAVREREVRLGIQAAIEGDVTTNGRRHFSDLKPEANDDTLSMCLKTDLGFGVCMRAHLEAQGLKFQPECAQQRCAIGWEDTVQANTTLVLVKRSVVTTSRDLDETEFIQHAQNVLEQAKSKTYLQLFEENEGVWVQKWRNSDVEIEGDASLQQGMRFSIYHLLRSNMEDDCRVQICAKGFAGEAYYGRYFWDTEIFLLPFFLYTNPKAAKNLVLYRYHTLDGARKNAERYHCHGARYPWQSALDGTEQCSLWEYADNEVHITADVAFAVMHYYLATGDEAFLRDYGLEMLLETARFWVDRVDSDGHGGYALLNVMGPDEYSPMTRNNAFTNRMVKENLKNAVWAAKRIHEQAPEQYANLAQKLRLQEEELERFVEIAEKLPIPYDEERRLYLQSEDFEGFADIDMDSIWLDRKRAFGHYATQEKIYRSKCIKQADVIALMTLFPQEFTDEQVAAAYDYYMPLTTHDSSLSPAGHSLIANRLGRTGDVSRFLQQVLEVDLSVEKKGSEDGIHIANCGCLWQLVVNSFAGMATAMEQQQLTLRPRLPEQIERIAFRVYWKGEQKQVIITKQGAEVLPVQ